VNAIKPYVCGGDAAFCQITVATCLKFKGHLQGRGYNAMLFSSDNTRTHRD